MRLSSALIGRALGQFEAQALPEDHPSIPQLKQLYGDHTFFLDVDGLSIAESQPSRNEGVKIGRIVSLADWDIADDQPTLAPHEPQPTSIVIILEAKH